ncbi:hypothetical protein B0T14DRAFT_427237 [Immersiella caudata]|uniref:Zn(2)-C6 fungal-type domain-containing protein n=1 Tax=Immersiella caudata TaxID=314043 RepID=A0AA39WXX9_9PEZI|nr:hypothetical protein B0T14DRAFT_427237 [Immersiella caudata]
MSSPAVHLRRNGAPRSCEACRKTKVKCDHSAPCNRCATKGLECVYAVAPATPRFRVARFDVSSGRVRTTRVRERARDQIEEDETSRQEPHQPPALQSVSIHLSVLTGANSRPRSPRQTTLEDVQITTPPVQPTSAFVSPGSYHDLSDLGAATDSSNTTTHTIDRIHLDLGLQIIDFVLAHSTLLQNQLHYVYRVIRMPVVPPKVMLPAVDSLFTTIHNDIPPGDQDAKLRRVIRIFQSSYQPIRATKHSTVDDICRDISGENVRFETIGNVLTMAGLCLIHIPARDFALLDPERRNKQDLMQPFHSITDTVNALLSASPVVNELGVCLKYNQLLLALYRFGDSSQRLYSSFMELTASMYAAGMHQDRAGNSDPAECAGLMYQWRRRCFASVYYMDKVIATNLGRPPLVPRNYCVLDAPLDLDDDELIGPGLDLNLQKLDRNGWNTDGRQRSTTYMRLQYLLATAREEALELHLGMNTCAASAKADAILQRLHMIWENCPKIVKYSSEIWQAGMCPHDIWFLVRFHLDYLYSIFLLRRFNARQNHSSESVSSLLSAAKNVLSIVLVFNEHRDIMREVRSDFSCIFLPYGLPCADVLAMELLHRPEAFSRSSIYNGGSSSTRAELIRELTVFASCLSWMSGKNGSSSKFSRETQKRLTKVLDQIVDNAPSHSTTITGSELQGFGAEPGQGAVLPDTAAPNVGHLFFDWDTSVYWDSHLDFFSQSLM